MSGTALHEPESAEELIRQIVRRELEDAKRPPPARRNRDHKLRPVLGVLLALVTGLTLWNAVVLRRTPTGLTADEAVVYLRVMSATAAVESYASDHGGRLPSALSQVEVDATGLLYSVEPDGKGFSIAVVVDGQPATFGREDVFTALSDGLENLPGVERR